MRLRDDDSVQLAGVVRKHRGPLAAAPVFRRMDGRMVRASIGVPSAGDEVGVMIAAAVGRLAFPAATDSGPTSPEAMRLCADPDEWCLVFTVGDLVVVVAEESCSSVVSIGENWGFDIGRVRVFVEPVTQDTEVP